MSSFVHPSVEPFAKVALSNSSSSGIHTLGDPSIFNLQNTQCAVHSKVDQLLTHLPPLKMQHAHLFQSLATFSKPSFSSLLRASSPTRPISTSREDAGALLEAAVPFAPAAPSPSPSETRSEGSEISMWPPTPWTTRRPPSVRRTPFRRRRSLPAEVGRCSGSARVELGGKAFGVCLIGLLVELCGNKTEQNAVMAHH